MASDADDGFSSMSAATNTGAASNTGEASNEGAAGIARRIDHLGRIVIPKEYRKVFGIRDGELLDMTLDGDSIRVRRLERTCVFCASHDRLSAFRGKLLCEVCASELRDGP